MSSSRHQSSDVVLTTIDERQDKRLWLALAAPPERERERGRTLLTIDKQSGARADDGGVANDTAAAVDSISIPLGGEEEEEEEKSKGRAAARTVHCLYSS